LVEECGEAAVRAHFERFHRDGAREAGQYVLGAANALHPIPVTDHRDARTQADIARTNQRAADTARDYPPSEVWYAPKVGS
jgi:hypothetical protein